MSDTPRIYTTLAVEKLRLNLCIGCIAWEQEKPQDVDISFRLYLPHPPQACESDELADTYCYHELTERIRDWIGDREIKTIEYLAWGCYAALREALGSEIGIWLRAEKCNPPVEGLEGGFSTELSDIPPTLLR